MLPSAQLINLGLKPGIYFDLPARRYHADSALSRSDMVNLLDTPNSYWVNSAMNPNPPKRISKPDMEYGEAFHYLLFQPHLFERLYRVVPVDPWDDCKQAITSDNYYKIVDSIKVLRAGKDSNLFLSGGQPEVTIVFDYAGMRFRVRIDYMTPVLNSDFKTTRELAMGLLKHEFGNRGYDIQYALYTLARRRFREQFATGEADVYGKVPTEFMEKFLKSRMDEFIFIFQRKTPPYPFLPLMPESDTEESGLIKIHKAIKIYNQNFKEYGTKVWPVSEGKTKAFSMFYGIREE